MAIHDILEVAELHIRHWMNRKCWQVVTIMGLLYLRKLFVCLYWCQCTETFITQANVVAADCRLGNMLYQNRQSCTAWLRAAISEWWQTRVKGIKEFVLGNQIRITSITADMSAQISSQPESPLRRYRQLAPSAFSQSLPLMPGSHELRRGI